MKLLRPRFCISLLVILLSLSISSTTNSDPTSAETHDWKGGEGVKRSRVRRQNINLPDTLSLPEKTYAFYFLWRLLSDSYDATNRTSARPVMNETTTLKTPHTAPSPPNSPKTTPSEESQLVQHSQTQTIPEASQVTKQNVLDTSAFSMKIPTKAAEESLANDQEQINHWDVTADTNGSSTAVGVFTTILSTPELQNMTELGDTQLDEQSTNPKQEKYEPEEPPSTTFHQQLDSFDNGIVTNVSSTAVEVFSGNSSTPDPQNTTELGDTLPAEGSTIPERKTPEPSQDTGQYIPQVTMQHVLDSTISEMKSPTKTTEEPLTNNHEQISPLDNITGTKDSGTDVEFLFPNSSTPESQNMTELEDTQLDEQSTNPERETHEPEEPPSTTLHEQLNSFDNLTVTNVSSTAVEVLSSNLSTPESQNTTELGDTLPAEGSAIPEWKTPELSKYTEQYIPQVTMQHVRDSTISEMKITTKRAEKPLTNNHEQINHFNDIAYTNDSSADVEFIFTNSSTTESQNITKLEDTQLDEQSTNPEREKYEPEEPPSTTFHEQMDSFDNFTITNYSTAVKYFSGNSSIPGAQNTTKLGNTLPAEESTIPEQKTPEPSQDTEQYISQVTEQYIPQDTEPHVFDSITSEIKSPTKTAEELLTTSHEQINHLDDIADTNDFSRVVGFFSTISSSPDMQNRAKLEDTQLDEQSTNPERENYEPEEPPSTTFHEQIDSFDHFTITNYSTAVEFFSGNSSIPGAQNTAELGDTLSAEEPTIPEQKTPEPSQDTEQYIPQVTEPQVFDFITSEMKSSTKTAEEPLTSNHEQLNHFEDIADTNDSSRVVGFFTTISSSLESQNMTELGDTQLYEQSTNPEHEKYEPEEPPSTTLHEQTDSFDNFTRTNDSTGAEFFSNNSSTPGSQNITELGDTLPAEESTIPDQKTPNPSQDTEQHTPQVTEQYIPQDTEPHILDSVTSEMKSSTQTAEEPLNTNQKQINHFDDIADTNDSSTAFEFLFTNSSTPESQNMTDLGDTQLNEQPTNLKWGKYEPEESTLTTFHERMTYFDRSTDTNDSTGVEFSSNNSSTPDSQNTTELGDTLPAEEPTIPDQKTPNPSQDTEQYVSNYRTFEMKITTNTSDEPPTITIYKQVDDVYDVSTPDFTDIPSSQESQKGNTLSSSLEILQTTPLASIPEQATIDKTEWETSLQTASHMSTYELLAPTIRTDIKTTTLSQSRRNEYPKPTPSIAGMVKGTVKTEESSTAKSKIEETPTTLHNGKPNRSVTAIDQTFPESTPTAFTLEQQIHNSSSPRLLVEMHNEVTSDPDLQKPTQPSSTMIKPPRLATMKSQTSFQSVDTLTQPSSKEKLTLTIPMNPKSSDKHISTTLVSLESRSQESSSTKPPYLHSTKTVEPNKKPTADTAPKKSYTNNNRMNKPTQSTTRHTTRTSTARLKTQTPSRKFIFKSAVSADDDTVTSRGFFALLFTLGCLILLITALLVFVAWRRWKARHWMNNMWVAGLPFLDGTYHSLQQISNPQTAIEMKRGKTQKKRPESSEIAPESVALQSEHADEDFSELHARPLSNM